jgi:hypothetical protein
MSDQQFRNFLEDEEDRKVSKPTDAQINTAAKQFSNSQCPHGDRRRAAFKAGVRWALSRFPDEIRNNFETNSASQLTTKENRK